MNCTVCGKETREGTNLCESCAGQARRLHNAPGQAASPKDLAVCSVMLALATILSFIVVYRMPQGGSISLFGMVPLLYIAYRYPPRWALLTALAYGLLHMLFSFYPPPARNIFAFAGVVLLDYLIAYGVLGLAGLFSRPFAGITGVFFGGSVAIALRLLCHFVSGVVIWSSYAPAGQPVALYSLLYNGSFMLGEWLLSMVGIAAMVRVLPKEKAIP